MVHGAQELVLRPREQALPREGGERGAKPILHLKSYLRLEMDVVKPKGKLQEMKYHCDTTGGCM